MIHLSKKIFLVGLLLLLTWLYSQEEKEVIPPEIYDTREFEILNKMSIHGEKKRYVQAIRTLKSPAVRLVKYYPDYVVKGANRRNHRIYQKELWLYVISKHFQGKIIIFIDSEIDGFVYESQDNEIDSVGILGKDGFKLLKFRGEDDDNGFLIFKIDKQFYTIKTSIYLKFFELAKQKSTKSWVGFNEEKDSNQQPKSLNFEDFVVPIPEFPQEEGFKIEEEVSETKAENKDSKNEPVSKVDNNPNPNEQNPPKNPNEGNNQQTQKKVPTPQNPQSTPADPADEYNIPELDFDF